MSQFSTNESTSLEKRILIDSNTTKTNPDYIDQIYDVEKCVKFILDNNYNKVCLQFPDYLLPDAGEIVQRLESKIGRKVYVLGDTAYESCCIDFTAAKHISADCIIHFGAVCFSKTELIIPFLNIYEKFDIDVDDVSKVLDQFKPETTLVLIDTPFYHKKDEIQKKLTDFVVVSVEEIPDLSREKVVYLGQNDRKLMNIYLQHKPEVLYYFDPKLSKNVINFIQDPKIIKRRYFLAEKIKDSQTIGVVISTLAVANYLKILERTVNLIKLHEKKYYIISVGKPNVAKLANFPEIDIFVVIGCSMNDIYDSRQFFKPIVTIFDLELALNSATPDFTYDFNDVLTNKINEIDDEASDVSLVTGQIRAKFVGETSDLTDKLMVRNDGKLALNDGFGAGFLSQRTFKGLEQDLGKTDVKMATKGRKGIPLNYENETK